MPILSIFFGIVVKLFHDDHNPPHVHIQYGEHYAIMEIGSGKLLAGKLPARALRLAREWRRLHVDELRHAWADAQSGRQPRRIAPLD